MSEVQANPGAMRHMAATLEQEAAALGQAHRAAMPLGFTALDAGQDYAVQGQTAATALNDVFTAIRAMSSEAQGLATQVRAASGDYLASDDAATRDLRQAVR